MLSFPIAEVQQAAKTLFGPYLAALSDEDTLALVHDWEEYREYSLLLDPSLPPLYTLMPSLDSSISSSFARFSSFEGRHRCSPRRTHRSRSIQATICFVRHLISLGSVNCK